MWEKFGEYHTRNSNTIQVNRINSRSSVRVFHNDCWNNKYALKNDKISQKKFRPGQLHFKYFQNMISH